MSPALTPSSPPAAPLAFTPQQMEELRQAQAKARKITRASVVALCDAWSIGVFAAISLPASLISLDGPGTLVSAAMVVVTIIEFRGAAALRKIDPEAPRLLAMNQVGFATALVLYGLWKLFVTGAEAIARNFMRDFGLGIGGQETVQLVTTAVYLLYGSLIALAIIGPGLMALYYFTRTKHMRAYLAEVPGWIVQLQRAGVRV